MVDDKFVLRNANGLELQLFVVGEGVFLLGRRMTEYKKKENGNGVG